MTTGSEGAIVGPRRKGFGIFQAFYNSFISRQIQVGHEGPGGADEIGVEGETRCVREPNNRLRH